MGEPRRQLLRTASAFDQVQGRDSRAPSRAQGLEPLQLRQLHAVRALQPQLAVGAADDPFEREAERTADAVMSSHGRAPGAFGAAPLAGALMPVVRRALGKQEPPHKKDDDKVVEDDSKKKVQRSPSTALRTDVVPTAVEGSIRAMQTGGEPLSTSLRASFEPQFGYDFSSVRTHTGTDAAGAAVALSARAFTVGDHIYFGAGEYQPSSASGQRLIAHELAHTIQQKPIAARPARVQRDLFPDPKAAALEKVSQWAGELPPYELLTVLLGRNPITDKPVERNARNFLHAALKLVPDGMAIFEDLEKNKTIEKTATWFDAEVTKLNLTWDGIKALFQQAWDSLGITDFVSPSKAWEKVKAIFGPTLKRIGDFALAVGGKIVEFVKKVALDKLGAWAKEQKGYRLLTFVLGRDPVTDEVVERTPTAFVRAVLELVPDGDKIFDNLQKSKTIEKTVAWLNGEITKLDLTWDKIKEIFQKAWNAFSVADLLHPIALLEKMAGIFLPPAKRVIAFAIAVGKKVLEFIFEGAMVIAGPIGLQIVGIVRKIGDTFDKIVADPIGFVSNLVQAVKLGFQQFSKNIWEHLKEGLIGWLVGALEGAGLVLPKVWDLKGILDLVLQILGITYAKVRAKLVKVVGEKTVSMLEKAFEFIMLLVTEGPAAAWQKIVEAIGSLWDMVIGGIKDWAVTKIVTAAITKIATMLNPAGAIIQAIIAIYNTVAFFIERIKQIVALVEAIVDSIANIAAGKLEQAANYVEKTMARTIPVILGFLARLIGLGDVSGAIKKVILAIQEKVDKAIDAVIKWVVDKAKSLFGKKDEDPKWTAAVAGVGADVDKMPEAERTIEGIDKRLGGWKTTYGFSALTVESGDDGIVIDGAMSPGKKVKDVPWPKGTEPQWGGLTDHEYGTSVTVERFPPKKQIPPGSTPGVGDKYYGVLNRRRYKTGSAYYVKGHLLNHNIGGTGKDWKNLTPLTQVANNRGKESMLYGFERHVKDAIDKKWSVTKFKVLATEKINRSGDLARLRSTRAAEKPLSEKRKKWFGGIEAVLEAENHIPATVECSVVIVDTKGNPKEPTSVVKVENDITTSWEDYTVNESV